MVFLRKIGGALKTFGGKALLAVGPLASYAKKHAPDVVELGTKVASMVPGPYQKYASASLSLSPIVLYVLTNASAIFGIIAGAGF